MSLTNVRIENQGFESRVFFDGFNKKNDINPETHKYGVRCHNRITAFFLGLFGKIEKKITIEEKTVSTADGKTKTIKEEKIIYLNKNSYNKWRERYTKQFKKGTIAPLTIEEIREYRNIRATTLAQKIMRGRLARKSFEAKKELRKKHLQVLNSFKEKIEERKLKMEAAKMEAAANKIQEEAKKFITANAAIAAITIQKVFRGYRARKHYPALQYDSALNKAKELLNQRAEHAQSYTKAILDLDKDILAKEAELKQAMSAPTGVMNFLASTLKIDPFAKQKKHILFLKDKKNKNESAREQKMHEFNEKIEKLNSIINKYAPKSADATPPDGSKNPPSPSLPPIAQLQAAAADVNPSTVGLLQSSGAPVVPTAAIAATIVSSTEAPQDSVASSPLSTSSSSNDLSSSTSDMSDLSSSTSDTLLSELQAAAAEVNPASLDTLLQQPADASPAPTAAIVASIEVPTVEVPTVKEKMMADIATHVCPEFKELISEFLTHFDPKIVQSWTYDPATDKFEFKLSEPAKLWVKPLLDDGKIDTQTPKGLVLMLGNNTEKVVKGQWVKKDQKISFSLGFTGFCKYDKGFIIKGTADVIIDSIQYSPTKSNITVNGRGIDRFTGWSFSQSDTKKTSTIKQVWSTGTKVVGDHEKLLNS